MAQGRFATRAGVGLFLLLCGAAPGRAAAQAEAHYTWALAPFLGLGVVRDNGSWASAGMETALEIQYGGTGWHWNAEGSLRGAGIGCSSADQPAGAVSGGCFDGGWGLAVGGARSVGRFWMGGGVVATDQFGSWRLLPFVRLSLDAAPVRLDLTMEIPQGDGSRLYMPLRVGIPIPRPRSE